MAINFYKWVVFFEAGIIICLLIFSNYNTENKKFNYPNATLDNNLVSSRLYAGILQPESYLIFNLEPLERGLRKYLNDNRINASIYIQNLRDGASISINPENLYEPASLNKIPLAMIIMRNVDDGVLSLDQELDINPEDRDSSSGILYASGKNKLSVKELISYMLSESDNTAANVLLRQISLEDLNRFSFYTGFYSKREKETDSYKITTKSMFNVFQSLYLSTFLEKDESELLLSFMAKSRYSLAVENNLPQGVIISHKFGTYYEEEHKEFHDCGIIYYEQKRFFYCVMTSGTNQDLGKKIVSDVIKGLFDYMIGVDKEIKEIY